MGMAGEVGTCPCKVAHEGALGTRICPGLRLPPCPPRWTSGKWRPPLPPCVQFRWGCIWHSWAPAFFLSGGGKRRCGEEILGPKPSPDSGAQRPMGEAIMLPRSLLGRPTLHFPSVQLGGGRPALPLPHRRVGVRAVGSDTAARETPSPPPHGLGQCPHTRAIPEEGPTAFRQSAN